jgi:soluble lytic murein transglycosylase
VPHRSPFRSAPLLLLLLLGALLLPVAQAATAPLGLEGTGTAAERQRYRDALADLYAVRLRAFDRKVEALGDYPLVPYLEYARLLRYVSSATPEDVAAFRARWADTPLADRALAEWLDNLARRGEWALYRAHHDSRVAARTEDRCRWYRSLLETGDRAGAFEGARELWVVGRSQPKACDPLFEAWIAAEGVTDDLAWERLRLALAAGNHGLGRYLLRFLAPESRPLAERFLALHRDPGRIGRSEALSGPEARVRDVVAHALRRLARRDPDAAERAWAAWDGRLALEPDFRARLRTELVRARARRGDLPADLLERWPPPDLVVDDSGELLEELTRHALADGDWRRVRGWIARMPERTAAEPAWRYWDARAAVTLGEAEIDAGPAARTRSVLPARALPPDAPGQQAVALPRDPVEAALEALASERNFYGFLAADLLGRPYALNDATLDLGEDELAAVATRPAVRRAFELRAVGDETEARREMAWVARRLAPRELLALAELARRAAWHRESIQATISAGLWDHLSLRFPLAYAGPMVDRARAHALEPSWLFAVARQESAFMTDARSRAGALGLMQLMPATARSTAQRFGIPYSSVWQLLDHEKNIEIGSSYLGEMFERFDRNRILASAAYNAGPARVERWLRERPSAPADVWIETIPFRETRGYVQNVLAYAVIYGARMEVDQPLLFEHERTIGR